MDFIEFIKNNEIEIVGNKIYKRYYTDSYTSYEIRDAQSVGFDRKFWVKEYDKITDYILVVEYSISGDFRGYIIKKGIDEKEVGYLYKKYDSSGEYYKFQPFLVEDSSLNSSKDDLKSNSSDIDSCVDYDYHDESPEVRANKSAFTKYGKAMVYLICFSGSIGGIIAALVTPWFLAGCFGVMAIIPILILIINHIKYGRKK